ncbi:DUF3492 domain-containing protein [Streptomyces sp. AM 2-1-1]|uniref:DUF3492 domain-containing protein n=1 Tax=Streptomyces sp. AM 2-1-1 TaxID=3028709 RepID=UPI0023B9354C|nr:DUF3492 domain-containing protein [Streptomyces sp. AM 2-1-1]WEH43645.1 DUF3492 domain-containing protein [Streptomyces sp. AM 2-1-1]
MRIGLLTHGGYPYADGESRLWCDRLVRGLPQHEFDLYALSRSARQEKGGWVSLPPQVGQVRTAPLWAADATVPQDGRGGRLARLVTGSGGGYGRRERRRFTAHLTALATAVSAPGAGGPAAGAARDARAELPAASRDAADGPAGTGRTAATSAGLFGEGLYGLAELAREHGGLPTALASETALHVLESACRSRGTSGTVQRATVADHLAFAAELARLLRPLSLDWYDTGALGGVDVCHAASGGTAALPGLLAKRFFGVPLLVTEHALPLRAHYLSATDGPSAAPVRALLANFHAHLAAEVYREAAVITPGSALVRRWQQRCGADAAKQRTVYPGMETGRLAQVGESTGAGPDTLVWVGRVEPAKDLVALLHAFAEVHRAEPGARLRIFGTAAEGAEGAAYLAHCRGVAERLFPVPGEREETPGVGDQGQPVSFEEMGGAGAGTLAEAYAAAGVVVLSSVVEGFPISLVEAMFCGRATVSTDVGAVVEVVGGTGVVVPPRDIPALADACLALLRDPERRARLGGAARARAGELFTVEQNLAAYRSLYQRLTAAGHPPRSGGAPRTPVRPATGTAPPRGTRAASAPRPVAVPAEGCARAGRWRTEQAERRSARVAAGQVPAWAVTPASPLAPVSPATPVLPVATVAPVAAVASVAPVVPEKVGAAAAAGVGDGDA